MSAATSVRPFDGDVPADVIGVTQFVTDPGETFATGAFAGSVNSTSRNCAMPLIMSSRITASADGVELRASSSVITMIAAAFITPSVVVPNASLVTGFGAPWPTQEYVPPPVCDGTDT